MRIILASASPRRRELLAQIGLDFEVIVSNVEEKVTTTVPYEVVEELSSQKAEGVLEEMQQGDEQLATAIALAPGSAEDMLIIGSDTIVACDGQILGKPKSSEDAKNMLHMLQGRSHEVYTGVTVLYVAAERCGEADVNGNAGRCVECATANIVQKHTFHEATKVHFYPMTEAEIEEYAATGDCNDKAGAYGIQGFCARYIKGIEGDYNNVVGLPVGRLYQEIKGFLYEKSSDF